MLLATFAFAGCKKKPGFAIGDHLIPLGSSDPAQIVTVVGVDKESYRVVLGVSETGGNPQTRTRKEIESYYVRVADLPVGGSWATPTPSPTPPPTPAPRASVAGTATPTATPTPSPTPTPIDAAKLARAATVGVVQLTFFDATDRPTKSALGCFISSDGRIVTTARAIEGAAKGIAELPNGAIRNVSGVLAVSAAADLAILKAGVTNATFLPLASDEPETGEQLAIAATTDPRQTENVAAATVGTVREEPAGASFQLTGTALRARAGAPVVNDSGEVVGFATTDESGETINGVRSAAAITTLLSRVPATTVPAWPGQTPTPTPKPKPSLSPGVPAGDASLVYTPYPRYPGAARFSYFGPKSGTGQFLIKFGADGAAMSVSVVRSTGNTLLDQAAMDTLRSWRAQRGRPTQKVVPITFRP